MSACSASPTAKAHEPTRPRGLVLPEKENTHAQPPPTFVESLDDRSFLHPLAASDMERRSPPRRPRRAAARGGVLETSRPLAVLKGACRCLPTFLRPRASRW